VAVRPVVGRGIIRAGGCSARARTRGASVPRVDAKRDLQGERPS
jgi:hypothetical protein